MHEVLSYVAQAIATSICENGQAPVQASYSVRRLFYYKKMYNSVKNQNLASNSFTLHIIHDGDSFLCTNVYEEILKGFKTWSRYKIFTKEFPPLIDTLTLLKF